MRHIKLLFGSFLFLLIGFIPLGSMAAEKADAVASVSLIQGPVHAIAPNGDQRQLSEGAPVYAGERVRTGENGAVVLVFADGTVWELLEDRSELKIAGYQFSETPGKSGEDRAQYEIVAGLLRYTSGEMSERGEGNIGIQFKDREMNPLGTKIVFAITPDGQLVLTVLEGALKIVHAIISPGAPTPPVEIIGPGQTVVLGDVGGATPINLNQLSSILGPEAAAALITLIEQGSGTTGTLEIRDNLTIPIPPEPTSPSSPNTP
jgi:hypothetical protein